MIISIQASWLNRDQKKVSSFPNPRSTSCLGRTLAPPLHKWIAKQNLNGWQNRGPAKTCPISRLSLACYTWRLCSAKTDLCGLPGRPHLSNGPSTREGPPDKRLINLVLENVLKLIFLCPVSHFSSLWFPLCFARNLSVKLQIGWNNAWTNIEVHNKKHSEFITREMLKIYERRRRKSIFKE